MATLSAEPWMRMMVGILEMLNGRWRKAFSGFFHLFRQGIIRRAFLISTRNTSSRRRRKRRSALVAVADKDEGAALLRDEAVDFGLDLGAVWAAGGGAASIVSRLVRSLIPSEAL